MIPFQPRRILAATDLSPASEAAIAFAADLAETVKAEVVLLHTISPVTFVDYGIFDDDTMNRALTRQSRAIEERLEVMAAESFPHHVKVIPLARSGYPISSICETAERERADLIVMGTHGRNPVVSFLVGSVVQGVLHRSSRPVITVPSRKQRETSDELLTILCPVNFTNIALEALRHAAALGEKTGAEVVALHLVEPEETTELGQVSDRLEHWIPKEIRDLCQIRVLVRRGDPAEEVIRYARTQLVDLIVIGAEHKRFADTTVLGTTTERVTRLAPCPVMTVMAPRPEEKHPVEERKEEEEAFVL